MVDFNNSKLALVNILGFFLIFVCLDPNLVDFLLIKFSSDLYLFL